MSLNRLGSLVLDTNETLLDPEGNDHGQQVDDDEDDQSYVVVAEYLVGPGKKDWANHAGSCPGSQDVAVDSAEFLSGEDVAEVGWDDGETSAVAGHQQAEGSGEDEWLLEEDQDYQHDDV